MSSKPRKIYAAEEIVEVGNVNVPLAIEVTWHLRRSNARHSKLVSPNRLDEPQKHAFFSPPPFFVLQLDLQFKKPWNPLFPTMIGFWS